MDVVSWLHSPVTLVYGLPFLQNPISSFLSAFLSFSGAKEENLKREYYLYIIPLTHLPFPKLFTGEGGESSYSSPYLSPPLHLHGLCPAQALVFSRLDHYHIPTLSYWSLGLQFCFIIHPPHCNQSDRSKTAHWVLLLSCFTLH